MTRRGTMSVVSIAEVWPPAGQPFTTDELDRMPGDGRRYELLDGVLVVSPRPGTIHQAVATRLAAALLTACPEDMFVISEPGPAGRRATLPLTRSRWGQRGWPGGRRAAR